MSSTNRNARRCRLHRPATRPTTLSLLMGAGMFTLAHTASAQILAPGYSSSVFATAPAGDSKPDSIVVGNNSVWVGYGNGTASDGSDGKSNDIVQYDRNGKVLHIYTIVGHNDGLKIDPKTGNVWVLQNQDGNPTVSIINPTTKTVTALTYAPSALTPGRGFDDVTFQNGKIFLSESNPAGVGDPVIVQATVSGSTITVSSILTAGGTTNPVTDSDSLTHDNLGHLVLDDQGGQLVFVSNPGTVTQSASGLALLNLAGAGISVDDTIFANNTTSKLLVTATGNNTIYAISGPFANNAAFSADTNDGIVGNLNLTTGELTPIFTDAGSSVHGLGLLSVPEPGTYAFLLAGAVTGAGLLLRRRARK